ncbi:hypothetical protein BDP55DRAFT_768498 [Colletotrichum godetiae]|uniref:FAD-binding domain-containing protein n=1 Tax=Colletotrichum godetiae TaxID=1209918 RepID=A0AAJ0ALE1_9PEZI|nr:uncharacterized protein BDP55DRAFT_768498 [Colletotrichum godetiae]KAK1675374.1 hypothetical protein BDP55DRAFT_768498 [Colletotrichum godetiae]
MPGPITLRVAIIGGGIAGLAAARVLREAHDVTIYERNSPEATESGAAVGLGPNGSKMAARLGLTIESLKAVVSDGFRSYDQSGNLLNESRIDCLQSFGSEWWMVHRQDLKDALLRVATGLDPGLPGRPAKIVYNSRVVEVNPQDQVVIFEDGSEIKADLIIGADGIHSKVRRAVAGPCNAESTPANLSLYRFTINRSNMSDILGEIPDVLRYDNGVFLSSFIATDGSNRNVVVYPCRNLEVMNFACAIPDTMLRHQTEESWSKDGDVYEMLESFKDFPPWLKQLMKTLFNVKLYQLCDADPLNTYTKDSTILIGDAAHPMVPYQGQGANQALEDAEAFRILVHPDFTKEVLLDKLKQWDQVRCTRASQVQLHSRVAAAKVSPEIIMQRMKFNWTYDGITSSLAEL